MRLHLPQIRLQPERMEAYLERMKLHVRRIKPSPPYLKHDA